MSVKDDAQPDEITRATARYAHLWHIGNAYSHEAYDARDVSPSSLGRWCVVLCDAWGNPSIITDEDRGRALRRAAREFADFDAGFPAPQCLIDLDTGERWESPSMRVVVSDPVDGTEQSATSDGTGWDKDDPSGTGQWMPAVQPAPTVNPWVGGPLSPTEAGQRA